MEAAFNESLISPKKADTFSSERDYGPDVTRILAGASSKSGDSKAAYLVYEFLKVTKGEDSFKKKGKFDKMIATVVAELPKEVLGAVAVLYDDDVRKEQQLASANHEADGSAAKP